MKIAINNLAIFCVIMLFYGQDGSAQTNNPKEFCRYGYNQEIQEDGTYIYVKYDTLVKTLPIDFFPWGVCFYKPSFISSNGINETSSQEDQWTREAMQEWNVAYRNYKINRWGSGDVVGIPKGPLFVESCDRYEHNIIYIFKDDLGSHDRDILGSYHDVDKYWDWRYFYAIIIMDTHHYKGGKPRVWERVFFINVMKHELGHGIALPHSKGSKTEIMTSRIGTGGKCSPRRVAEERICGFTDYDFERFLWPYDPPSLAEHQRQQEMARLHDERQMRWYETGCPHFPSIGSNGRRLIGCP